MNWIANKKNQHLDIDNHEQARGYISIQASLDLELSKYNFKNGGKPFPFTFTHVQARGTLPCGFQIDLIPSRSSYDN
jgi:hypothetical protein